MAKQYWLMKSEPEVFSIDDLQRVGREAWEGVRNYQARNNMRAMKVDDLVLFYHSRAEAIGVVGVCKVCVEAYPDPTQFKPKSEYFDPKSPSEDPRWSMVDVAFVERFTRTVTLAELKADAALTTMVVTQKGSRLSVTPVLEEHFVHVLGLASAKTKVD